MAAQARIRGRCRAISVVGDERPLFGLRFLALIEADEAGDQQRHVERAENRLHGCPDLGEGT